MRKKEKNRKKFIWKWKGSYTLEAVFVIPLVLGIIFAWMFELFYFHDQVVLSGIMQQNLIRQVGNMQDSTEMEIQRELEKKLWLLEINSLKEKEGLGKSRYRIKANVAWDVPVMREFSSGILKLEREWECYSKQPEYLLRFRE